MLPLFRVLLAMLWLGTEACTGPRELRAALHRLYADVEIATPARETWASSGPDVLIYQSGRVYLELGSGTPDEAERARVVLKTLVA